MLLDDSLNRIETEARPFSDTLRREEGLKDMWLDLRRDSRAIVRDLYDNAVIFAIGANPQFPLPIHRVDCIVDQIRPDLIQFAAKGIHQQGHRLIVAVDSNSALEFVIEDGKSIFKRLDDVHVLDWRLIHKRVFLNRLHEIGNTRCAAFDFIQKSDNFQRCGYPYERGASGIGIKRCEELLERGRIEVAASEVG